MTHNRHGIEILDTDEQLRARQEHQREARLLIQRDLARRFQLQASRSQQQQFNNREGN